ncbi:MAG: tetratricopeptide repeat protein [Chloroflexota bacterium]
MNSKAPNAPLNERVRLLMDELSLALQWDSPCILLAVYQSEITRNKVELSLKQFIEQAGQTVQELRVTKTGYDIPLILRDFPTREGTIFFVSGLQWGGGRGYSNAYRALNMHREYLIEAKIRSVFWVTQREFKHLPRYAPDFWAFRHKAVDFLDLPSRQDVALMECEEEDYESAIERYEKLLRRDSSNSSVRQKLAELYRGLGCYEEAVSHYRKSIRLAPETDEYLLALAQIYLDWGQNNLALRTRRRAKRLLEKGR